MLQMVLRLLRGITKLLMSVFDPSKIQITVPQFPMDQIIGVKTGSYTVAAGGPGGAATDGSDEFQTNFGDSCLFVGLFSVDNGVSWYTNGSIFPNGVDPTAGQLTLSFAIESDVDGTVSASSQNFTRSAYTVLYKIALLAKPDQLPLKPLPTTDILSYKSNLNYMKIVLDNVITLPPSGSQVIPHNLGYVPNFLFWVGSDESTPSDNRILFQGGANSGAVIDSENLTLTNSSASRSRKVYYRIYADA